MERFTRALDARRPAGRRLAALASHPGSLATCTCTLPPPLPPRTLQVQRQYVIPVRMSRSRWSAGCSAALRTLAGKMSKGDWAARLPRTPSTMSFDSVSGGMAHGQPRGARSGGWTRTRTCMCAKPPRPATRWGARGARSVRERQRASEKEQTRKQRRRGRSNEEGWRALTCGRNRYMQRRP